MLNNANNKFTLTGASVSFNFAKFSVDGTGITLYFLANDQNKVSSLLKLIFIHTIWHFFSTLIPIFIQHWRYLLPGKPGRPPLEIGI
jgi:hypothetical protein